MRYAVPIPADRLDFLWRKLCQRVRVDGECWVWTGKLLPNGYGKVSTYVDGVQRTYYTHRIAYVHHFGEPDGPLLVIDHLCRNKACVFPGHLEAVSQRENVLRGYGATAENARKTHCDMGHEYTEDNTAWVRTKYGIGRNCRECGKIEAKRKRLALWQKKVAALEAELGA